MQCGYLYDSTTQCQREARVRFKLNGALQYRYVCTIHLNRELRKMVAFDSQRLIEIGFCA